MVSRTDKEIRASIRDMGRAIFCGMAYLLVLFITERLCTRQDISEYPRFSVRHTRKSAESGKAVKASPAGRCAGLDRPSLASGNKYSRATDEEASGGGSVKGI